MSVRTSNTIPAYLFILRICFFFACAGLFSADGHHSARGARRVSSEESVSTRAAGLIASRCLTCHDSAKKAGGLDLSSRAQALQVHAIVGGNPEQSKLVKMVVSGKMPPTGRLKQEEVSLLREWISSGGNYPREPLTTSFAAMAPLWSLNPISNPAAGHSRFDALARNQIDRFVFRKLHEKGLSPSPTASKAALLRRIALDLTGLPPTLGELRAFMTDSSPNAYNKVVDRLLDSPAYGERWARHWLDVVRFGESNGYEQNHLRPNAWRYRDYVIRSFNEDEPFDRFVAEQLAGDVLGKGDPDIQAATGFLVAGVHDTVGIQEEEGTRQQRINDLEDMVSTTGAALLGLTVGCARCHDHKFDPIPQRDFYRFAACFAGVRHGDRVIGKRELSAKEKEERERTQRDILSLTNEMNALDDQARQIVLRGRKSNVGTRPAVNARRNIDEFTPAKARFVRFTVFATRDGTEPCIDELQVFAPGGDENLALAANGAKATASSVLPGFAIHQIAHLNDGLFGNEHSWISIEPGKGWVQIELAKSAVISRISWSRDAAEIPRLDDRLPTAYRIEISIDGQVWKTVSTDAGRSGNSDYVHPDALRAAMTSEQRERRAAIPGMIDKLKKRSEELSGDITAYAGTFTTPDQTYLLRRGDVMQRVEQVQPGALSAIPAPNSDLSESAGTIDDGRWTIDSPIVQHAQGELKSELRHAFNAPSRVLSSIVHRPSSDGMTESARRVALARWITDPKNPLMARVIVNRIWQHHFGRGIVGTPSDFGRNGEKPSHPELLDWLANDFMCHGWKMKRLHRMICLSYIYQQSSDASGRWTMDDGRSSRSASRTTGRRISAPEQGHNLSLTKTSSIVNRPSSPQSSIVHRQSSPNPNAIDAGNLYLWRMPLRRLEAEAVRDSILQTSGKLDRTMGGPSYRLFQYNVVNVAIYQPLEQYGPETFRRGIYSEAARGIRDNLLGAFDCPESSQRAPRRDSTTTALQALAMLNGTFINQQASFFADRVRSETGTKPEVQIARAFGLAFGRTPSAAEAASALRLVQSEGLPALCRALMNVNEFLYY